MLICLIASQLTTPSIDYPEIIEAELPETVDFNFHIRPILSNNCFVCHGPDESSREANLRLDNYEDATAELENGAAIIPRNPDASLLMQRITSSDPDWQMPPADSKKQLTPYEIGLLRKWIEQGANWKEYWAFIPPEKPIGIDHLSDPSAVIDHLINQSLTHHSLQPAAKADNAALIRRVAYLMTGLPPTSTEVQDFLKDNRDNAYEKIVDNYLASPHFGERWARHWMDLMRYGESMGHEGDFNISHAYEYRDYLIRAFNQDVPYDLFVKEHLAGDLLKQPRYHPESGVLESPLGTAYLFLGEGKHSPVDIKQEEADKIDNMIDVTAKTFQGLTVSCARCHDHKFDPIPTTDYYAMYGMIESARITPIPARRTNTQESKLVALKQLKKEIFTQLQEEWQGDGIEFSTEETQQHSRFINQLATQKDTSSFQLLVDFRTGNKEGWYATGWAFGENPLQAEPLIDRSNYTLSELRQGMVSSRVYGTGLQGVLRSPNFLVEHDSIIIKARGNASDIRIIVENFQTIQNPLYGGLEKQVNNDEWQTYVFDLTLVQGRKAYFEFMSGTYNGGKHEFSISEDSYVEVQYAVAFNNVRPDELALSSVANPIANEKDQIAKVNQQLQANPYKVSRELKEKIKQYDALAYQLRDTTHVLGVVDGDAVFSPVFNRGSINNVSEEKVKRQFLSAIDLTTGNFPQEGSGRLAWAASVIDPKNPLTARVLVNRLWHHTFGRGIVESVDNFGLQGALPSHPALLDYLALLFVEEGWSIKTLLKYLLLSETFQRSTTTQIENQEIDPENIYLHHFPIRRLEAEAIRDGILTVSSSLDRTFYGSPIPVHLTEFMTGRGRPRASGPLDGAGRRSIYTAIRRNFLPPFMLTFDFPIPFTTFGKRNTTNVPAQSLTLLNDPFVHEQAQKWGERVAIAKGSLEEKVQQIYWTAFARSATEMEVQQAVTFIEEQAAEQEKTIERMVNDPLLWEDYCHAIFNMKEFIYLR